MTAAKRILVVDDSATVRKQVREALEGAGLTVVEAENGERALRVLAERDPVDLLLVDVNMPIMDGYEVIRRTRAMSRYAALPIFVMTTEAGTKAIKEGKAAGANAWILKPMKPDLLTKGVRNALGA
jgi:two-component system, chemotaxis family, chemotaxis protein CheY